MARGEDLEQAAHSYQDILEQAGYPATDAYLELLKRTARGLVYGPIVTEAVTFWHNRLQAAEPHRAARALGALTLLMHGSEVLYESNPYLQRPEGWMRTEAFQQQLAEHHENVRRGIIALLDEPYRMAAREGQAQVRSANLRLAGDAALVRDLADFNYEVYFSGSTMASAADLQASSVEDLVESDDMAKMPHLSRSNLWMRQKITGIMAAAKNQGIEQVAFMDLGSGTGATLAAAIDGVVDAKKKGDDLPRVSFTGIDSNDKFQEALTTVVGDAKALLKKNDVPLQKDSALIHGDMVEELGKISRDLSRNDLLVVTANYSLHRIPTDLKVELFGTISTLARNKILLIGDLRKNASTVNLGYFNLAANGPLNAGNLDLTEILQNKNYKVSVPTDLGHSAAMSNVDQRLEEALNQDRLNDGHLWLAWNGPKANDLVLS